MLVAAALALTACSGDGDDSAGSGGQDGTSASPSATGTAGTGGTDGGSGDASASAGKLEGSWLATTDGKAVALVVTGKQAALFATGGAMCSGTSGESEGTTAIRLKCTDGSDDRTRGTVDSVTATTLKVNWVGGIGEETYQKAEGGKLPSGLATASSGS
ncbi:hypothetical protein ACFV6E_24080 [Streptomyces sp. NPDC059785]|uniref:hypothetical protein n=1 Tax=Streptomyces sp. NPDC059785 TaxID=3346945 RepID=UPI003657C1E2